MKVVGKSYTVHVGTRLVSLNKEIVCHNPGCFIDIVSVGSVVLPGEGVFGFKLDDDRGVKMAVNILKMSIFVIVSLALPKLRSIITSIIVSSQILHLITSLAEVC